MLNSHNGFCQHTIPPNGIMGINIKVNHRKLDVLSMPKYFAISAYPPTNLPTNLPTYLPNIICQLRLTSLHTKVHKKSTHNICGG